MPALLPMQWKKSKSYLDNYANYTDRFRLIIRLKYKFY